MRPSRPNIGLTATEKPGSEISGIFGFNESTQLAEGLAAANIAIDRKALAELAVQDPTAFKSIFDRAAEALQKKHAA
jgi:hypothetical protein